MYMPNLMSGFTERPRSPPSLDALWSLGVRPGRAEKNKVNVHVDTPDKDYLEWLRMMPILCQTWRGKG